MRICGIYKIQSKKKPERIYVGSSVDINKRWSAHKRDLIRQKHVNRKLQNHANKYGLGDLDFVIIVCCGKEEVIAYEQFYIDALDPFFNLCPTADSPRGVSHESRRGKPTWQKGKHFTEEHKRKLSEAMRGDKNHRYGKPSPKKGQKGYPSPFKGKKGRYSEETLQRMRESNKRAWETRKQKQKEEISCPA